MPTEIKLWRIEEDRPKPVSQDKLDLESRLENWLRDDIGLVNDDLLMWRRSRISTLAVKR